MLELEISIKSTVSSRSLLSRYFSGKNSTKCDIPFRNFHIFSRARRRRILIFRTQFRDVEREVWFSFA